MEVLKCSNIIKAFDGQVLFQAPELIVNQGDRIGLVGSNGSGKSTLLKMIVGEDRDYRGRITLKKSFAYVPQLKEPSKASGGEEAFGAIREALSRPVDLLILDEPTSNLDARHLARLLEALSQFPGAVILVSHDRAFLDQTVQQIWAIDQGQISLYPGNYSHYKAEKQKEVERQAAAYAGYKNKLDRLEKEAQGRMERAKHFKKKKRGVSDADFKVKGYTGRYDGQQKALARSAKALEKRIDRLEKPPVPQEDRSFQFKELGPVAKEGARTLVNLQAGSVQAGGRPLFAFSGFRIQAGDKVSVTGPNKAGKTTFLRQIINHDLAGYYADDLRIGYFAQDFTVLDGKKSIRDNIGLVEQPETVVRTLLASLGFNGYKMKTPVAQLSGGERVRLSIAKVLLGSYHLLILDEPTNYLDIPTREALEHFIQGYPGAVILVSHDQAFVQATTDRHYFIDRERLVSSAYLEKKKRAREDQVLLLQFQLDRLMMDERASLEAIRQVQRELDDLKKMDG
ncbi:ribosomal protection-like ABC-F family protein [Peptococcus simiae]|uniref:ribosomal protection-like ABC-F family protein n=1 Tax=Peptococcus simiae TaxID=1643805 RepID=UPI00397FF095